MPGTKKEIKPYEGVSNLRYYYLLPFFYSRDAGLCINEQYVAGCKLGSAGPQSKPQVKNGGDMENIIHLKDLAGSLIYSFVGLILFGVAFFIFDRITPGKLWQEILEKQNTAAAIVVGALIIGISIIVGLAIH